ncbi:MAG: class I SAM-dependent methyltransferase [Candidatus Magasanikbacteria bacterium]|nr:class I SAM-dependent methyltransferase [Candidatus Magasanikbacteria bacterium]
MDEQQGKLKAKAYYDQEAADYIAQYRDDYSVEYPANLIRIKFIIERLKQNGVKTILDAGCGTCGPMIRLLKEGFDVRGFDFSKEMVEQGKKELENAGFSPDLISWADLEDTSTLPQGSFDAILALGVFPHIINEPKSLTNMHQMLNTNGLVFIEFRNDLFASYTFNRYSLDFFLNRVIDLPAVPNDIKDELIQFYANRLQVEPPAPREDGKIAYTDILAKFKNPLTIGSELFKPCGLSIVHTHFYHFHALPPVFEQSYPQIFRELSLKMENTLDWRGNLMASAFVIEAKKEN